MRSMILKRNLALLLLLCGAGTAVAQSDFGIWTGVSAEKAISKKISVEAGVEMRLEDNATQPTRWDFSAGVGYKPWKFLKFGAGYTFIHDRSLEEAKAKYKTDDDDNLILHPITGQPQLTGYNVDHGFWRNKHRAYFDVTGKVAWGRFTFSLRERYLFTHYNEATCLRDKYRTPVQPGYTGETYTYAGTEFITYSPNDEEDVKAAKNRHLLRSRVQVEYNIKGLPLNPYASYEVTNELGDALRYDKSRVVVGVDWKIRKKHVIGLGYLFQTGPDDDDGRGTLHAVKVDYKIKF